MIHRFPGVSIALLLVAVAACSPSGGGSVPPIVLITLDTFRPDYLGCAGNPVVRTPHLDRFARAGTHWTEAVTSIPLTTPSHATILSGMTPRAHGLLKNRMRLDAAIETLPEILREGGFVTGAVVSSPLVLSPELGLDQGFDDYRMVVKQPGAATVEGPQTTELALDWLREEGRAHDSFLWVHYYDTHLPYRPPSPLERLYDPDYDGPFEQLDARKSVQEVFAESDSVTARDVQHVIALYASEVTFLDRCVGSLIRGVRAAPGGAHAWVVVTADHGETLYEHERYFGHDIQLYETSLRVPLLVVGPGVTAGRLVQEPARTRDIAPTILGFGGMPPGAQMVGRDLLREAPPEGRRRQFVAETYPAKKKAPPLYAMRTDTNKVVWQPRKRRWEYYDLVRDPAERQDLAGTDEAVYQELAQSLKLDLRNRPALSLHTIDDARGGPDPETRRALESLGYLD